MTLDSANLGNRTEMVFILLPQISLLAWEFMFRQQSFRQAPKSFYHSIRISWNTEKVFHSLAFCICKCFNPLRLWSDFKTPHPISHPSCLLLLLFCCPLNYNISVSVAAERICPDFLWHLSRPPKRFFVTLAGICPSGMKLTFSNWKLYLLKIFI